MSFYILKILFAIRKIAKLPPRYNTTLIMSDVGWPIFLLVTVHSCHFISPWIMPRGSFLPHVSFYCRVCFHHKFMTCGDIIDITSSMTRERKVFFLQYPWQAIQQIPFHRQQRNHQKSILLVLCEGNPQWLVHSPHKGSEMWKVFASHDIIMPINIYMVHILLCYVVV